MIKNVSISVYFIYFGFAVISLFLEQFDWLHTLLLFCLAFNVSTGIDKEFVIYIKSWTLGK